MDDEQKPCPTCGMDGERMAHEFQSAMGEMIRAEKALRAENDALRAKWDSIPWMALTVAVEYSLVEEYFASPDVEPHVRVAEAWLKAHAPHEDMPRYEVTTITEDVGL